MSTRNITENAGRPREEAYTIRNVNGPDGSPIGVMFHEKPDRPGKPEQAWFFPSLAAK